MGDQSAICSGDPEQPYDGDMVRAFRDEQEKTEDLPSLDEPSRKATVGH